MIDRRTFVNASAGLLLWPLSSLARGRETRVAEAGVSSDLEATLEKSPYVYISPLRSDGEESTCHGEVWFGWIDGAVVLNTGSERWKSRSVKRGLDRARIWVGDYGRWKKMIGRNEAFRRGPGFDARASIVKDDALLDRLLEVYEGKYPEEIGEWRDKMRSGYRDGSRALIRYVPDRPSRT